LSNRNPAVVKIVKRVKQAGSGRRVNNEHARHLQKSLWMMWC